MGAAIVENNMAVSQKTKNRVTTWSGNSTPGYISEKQQQQKNKSNNLKKYMHPNVHSCIIYNCRVLETT